MPFYICHAMLMLKSYPVSKPPLLLKRALNTNFLCFVTLVKPANPSPVRQVRQMLKSYPVSKPLLFLKRAFKTSFFRLATLDK